MMSRKKKVLVALLGLCLGLGLSACGLESKWIFSLNGEKLYDKEVTIFGLMYIKEHNMLDGKHLEEIKEEDQTYGEYYKKEIEKNILDTVLMFKAAKEEHYRLDKKGKNDIQKKTKDFMNSYGEEFLKEKEIASSDVEKIYEMRTLGNAYFEQFFDNKEDKTKNAKERYLKVYQISFLTVGMDENGKMKFNSDGTVQYLSDEESMKKKAEADSFVQRVKEGESIEELLKEYDSSVKGMEKYLKYEDLNASYKKAVDACDEGEVTDVIKSTYGYYVVKILEKDASEYADSMLSHTQEKELQTEKEKKIEELYEEHIHADKKYKNEERWNAIDLHTFLQ